MATKKQSASDIIQRTKETNFFSWSAQKSVNPIAMTRAEGVYFWDADGKKYLDFSSQLMNMNAGHQHPKIVEAIKKQADTLCFAYPGMATPIRAEAAEKLLAVCPKNMKKVFYGLGGADSVENAIKMARMVTGRHKIVSHYRAFHGGSMGAATAGGDPRRIGLEPMISGIVRVLNPYCYRCPFGQTGPDACKRECLQQIEDVFQMEGPETIAAVLFEGVSGTSGILLPPDDWWPAVKKMCDKYGILTIADEVMSGFGRTGKWFGVNHYKIEPDLMVMAKGLTCGYIPLSAVVASEKIANHFDDKTLLCGMTYNAHPMGLAASAATLDVYKEDKLIENAAKMGDYQSRKHREMTEKHISVGDTRNIGLFGVIEVVKDRKSREGMAPFNAKGKEMEIMNKVGAKLKELGMSTFVRWQYIFTVPPLCVTKGQLDEGYAIIDEALKIADQHYEGKK